MRNARKFANFYGQITKLATLPQALIYFPSNISSFHFLLQIPKKKSAGSNHSLHPTPQFIFPRTSLPSFIPFPLGQWPYSSPSFIPFPLAQWPPKKTRRRFCIRRGNQLPEAFFIAIKKEENNDICKNGGKTDFWLIYGTQLRPTDRNLNVFECIR